jgi:tryptophan-rich sensory protein
MKYLKIAGIVWGLIYFAMGALKSFTFNSNDTWASVALLFALFLLPLPITVIAVWLPKVAGKALLACIAVNVVAVVAVVVARHTHPLSDIGQFIVFIVLYDLPHLFFGVSYIRSGRASKIVDSSGHGQSVGVA